MIFTLLAAAVFGLAAVPTIIFFVNLRFFTPPRKMDETVALSVSLLIPARNEAKHIAKALERALASEGVSLEVIVLDDQSTDDTAAIARAMAQDDPRVRVEASTPLPPGWCGKQHACWQLANLAANDILIFVDADVDLAPTALARVANELASGDAGLISLFPCQVTVGMAEQLVIPLMHLVLLGFLPLWKMRTTDNPAFAAGCGQIFAARRRDYFNAGGHELIRASRHDGIMLPRAFRRRAIRTDLVDGTHLATCRMYDSVPALVAGLAKNATEGLASAKLILPATILLFCGQVLAPILWLIALVIGAPAASVWAGIATLMTLAVRLTAAAKFDQSISGALLNPIGVTILVIIQWYAFGCRLCGKSITWRGRPG